MTALTMTRLPSDSFLPSGAFTDTSEHHLSFAGLINGTQTSVISPLSLPRAVNQVSSVDDQYLPTLPQSNYLNPSQRSRYLSPNRAPSPNRTRDQRSVSLSPTRYQMRSSNVTSPSLSGIAELNGTTSPDQLSGQAALIQLRRVTQQNRRLLENWEAERTHLEANRARAEEIYREERVIMDEERLAWDAERLRLVAETQALAQHAANLEQEKAELVRMVQMLQGGSNTSKAVHELSNEGAAATLRGGGKSSPPSNGVSSTAMKFRSPSDGPSPGNAGRGFALPESHPFNGLDPLLQGSSPGAKSPEQTPEQDNIPSIDINEIDSKLEGIPLKVTAVKKATFTDGKSPSPPSSTTTKSPPAETDNGSPKSRSRASPSELTQETLQAPETARLTLHAGHTPNHSLSLLATVVSTAANNTAGSSGASTPTQSIPPEDAEVTKNVENHEGKGSQTTQQLIEAHEPTEQQPDARDDAEIPEALLEPSEDDPALTGPLMLRNRQASDEVFLSALNNKLESTRYDSTPTVLLRGDLQQQAAPAVAEPATVRMVDGSADDHGGSTAEPDVPLKLKKNSNFGAPLGELGSLASQLS